MSQYVKTINADLLNATEQYIAHQCNCISINACTLAKDIFKKFPHSNTYNQRIKYDKSTYSMPGTITIHNNIINMYAQYYPSLPKYNNDTFPKRLEWFNQCLNEIGNIDNIQNKTIAMPYNIGCGAGGGDWNIYYGMICEFADRTKINITLYKK